MISFGGLSKKKELFDITKINVKLSNSTISTTTTTKFKIHQHETKRERLLNEIEDYKKEKLLKTTPRDRRELLFEIRAFGINYYHILSKSKFGTKNLRELNNQIRGFDLGKLNRKWKLSGVLTKWDLKTQKKNLKKTKTKNMKDLLFNIRNYNYELRNVSAIYNSFRKFEKKTQIKLIDFRQLL